MSQATALLMFMAISVQPIASLGMGSVKVTSSEPTWASKSSQVVSATCEGLRYSLTVERRGPSLASVSIKVGGKNVDPGSDISAAFKAITEQRVMWLCDHRVGELSIYSLRRPAGGPTYFQHIRANFPGSNGRPRVSSGRMSPDDVSAAFPPDE